MLTVVVIGVCIVVCIVANSVLYGPHVAQIVTYKFFNFAFGQMSID